MRRLMNSLVLLVLIMLISCGTPPSTAVPLPPTTDPDSETLPTPTQTDSTEPTDKPPQPTNTLIPDGEQPAWIAPDTQTCLDYQYYLGEAVGAGLGLNQQTEFYDYISGTSGLGCQIITTVTGDQLGDPANTYNQIAAYLTEQGLTEDIAYSADGPTGTASGYYGGAMLVLVAVSWTPVDPALCPDDQPIGLCDLTDAQKLYTIDIRLAYSGE